MRTVSRFFIKLHRVLGVTLSLFFLVWFLSGFVMLFRSFPKISEEEKQKGLQTVSQIADEEAGRRLDSLFNLVDGDSLESLRLRATEDRGYELRVSKRDTTIIYRTNGQSAYTFPDLVAYAERFRPYPIERIDTISDVDTWIPYRHRSNIYPAYKFYYQDEERTELYVSSIMGDGVQVTTESSRLWSYLGAIPHWIYFSSLRQHRDLWADIILVISGLGTLMCLGGMYVGIRSYWKTRKSKRGVHSPYKQIAYRLHHQLGFLFGLLVCGFVFSGFMSLQSIPEWLIPVKSNGQERMILAKNYLGNAKLLSLTARHILSRLHNVKQIEWLTFGHIPYIKVSKDDGQHYLTLDREHKLVTLSLTRADVEAFTQQFLGPKLPVDISLLTEYDSYYIHRSNKLPLPVYRVELSDKDGNSYYINPASGNIIHYNSNKRLRHLLYHGLHSYLFKPLVDRPLLWWSIMLLSLVLGTVISYTGVHLSCRYLTRKLKRR